MSSKDFKALADALREARPLVDMLQLVQWRRDVRSIADACESLAVTFDREKFYNVCGYQEGRR